MQTEEGSLTLSEIQANETFSSGLLSHAVEYFYQNNELAEDQRVSYSLRFWDAPADAESRFNDYDGGEITLSTDEIEQTLYLSNGYEGDMVTAVETDGSVEMVCEERYEPRL